MKPHARLEAFGVSSPWFAWSVAHGLLDGFCTQCRGTGVVIASPCPKREIVLGAFRLTCTSKTGCDDCRGMCPRCKGQRLEPAAVLLPEDFGDDESLEAAQRMFPSLVVAAGKRIDMHAPALEWTKD